MNPFALDYYFITNTSNKLSLLHHNKHSSLDKKQFFFNSIVVNIIYFLIIKIFTPAINGIYGYQRGLRDDNVYE